jgi:hypothetical protein
MSECIVNYWPAWFRALYGGDFPRSYCCVDVETTGYSFDRDLITEWGHCLVKDGKIVDELSLVVDWTSHAVVPDHWLRRRLDSVRYGMQLSGLTCHMSWERMESEGLKPDKALGFIRDFTSTLQKKGVLFVTHGGTFDEKMICANLRGFKAAEGFSFGDNGMIDTEGVAKASQMPGNPRFHPQKNDTLRSYFHRVRYTRAAGLKSNLDTHCFERYGFEKHGVVRSDMHAALVDCRCVHYLMEEFRGLIKPAPEDPPVFPSADHREVRKAPPPRAPARAAAARVRGQRNS